MTYKKIYPSNLSFNADTSLYVSCKKEKPNESPDIWAIKYLLDKGMPNVPIKVYINCEISKTMALRMYFLKYLFSNIHFHDADGDKFKSVAEEIKDNIGKKYITYESNKYPLNNRGTKDAPESHIEEKLSNNLSKYVSDFSDKVDVIRQFPANIFKKEGITEGNRITDKLWIDMISVNTYNELSAIELKVGNNIPLELFAQGLNYGIYCHLFKEHINKNWFDKEVATIKDKISIYYIGEEFHPALFGRDEDKGIVSLIRRNDMFNVVFVKIDINKNKGDIKDKPKIIYDTRNL